MLPTILAVDQSTSSTKAILFDKTGKVLDKAAADHRQIYPQPGWVEHDAEEIWRNVQAVVRDIASRNNLANLVGISISNQRETILAFDRLTGKPLYNAIVWQDRRGDALCHKLRAEGHDGLVRPKTGLKIDTYFSASKIAWLMANNPDIASKLKEGTAVLGTIDAYLIHRLTGGTVFATDYTNASRTLIYDIESLRWDDDLCALFSVPKHALPEVRECFAPFGDTDVGGALPRRIPIVGVIGDSQASLFAQRCYRAGDTKATFGTGTSVMLNIGDRFKLGGEGSVSALAWMYQGKPTYAFEGIINFCAASVAWLKNQLGLFKDNSEIEPLATAVQDNGGVYLVPAFAGLSAPYWAPNARAAILGMTGYTQREHIVRAALESISYQVRDVLDMMRSESGVHLHKVHADGGPTRNAFLMQFTADITGMALQVSEVAESSAWGAAMGGLLGLGIYSSLDDLATIPTQAIEFTPKMPAADVKRFHDGWTAAIKRVV